MEAVAAGGGVGLSLTAVPGGEEQIGGRDVEVEIRSHLSDHLRGGGDVEGTSRTCHETWTDGTAGKNAKGGDHLRSGRRSGR